MSARLIKIARSFAWIGCFLYALSIYLLNVRSLCVCVCGCFCAQTNGEYNIIMFHPFCLVVDILTIHTQTQAVCSTENWAYDIKRRQFKSNGYDFLLHGLANGLWFFALSVQHMSCIYIIRKCVIFFRSYITSIKYST